MLFEALRDSDSIARGGEEGITQRQGGSRLCPSLHRGPISAIIGLSRKETCIRVKFGGSEEVLFPLEFIHNLPLYVVFPVQLFRAKWRGFTMKPNKTLPIALMVILTLAFTLSCNALSELTAGEEVPPTEPPPATEAPEPTVVEQPEDVAPGDYQKIIETEFGQQLNSGDITLDGIQANSQESDTFGPILTIQLTNPGTDEVIVTLPCGLVFTPSDADNQPLMMVQPLQVTLAAGETQEVTPYVVCIDVGTAAPNFNNTYTVGSLVDIEQLLKYAECICNEELSDEIGSMDGVGVQFAAWTITTGGDFSQAIEAGGAMAEFFEEEYGEEMEEMVEILTEMMSLFSADWLERCEIELEQ